MLSRPETLSEGSLHGGYTISGPCRQVLSGRVMSKRDEVAGESRKRWIGCFQGVRDGHIAWAPAIDANLHQSLRKHRIDANLSLCMLFAAEAEWIVLVAYCGSAKPPFLCFALSRPGLLLREQRLRLRPKTLNEDPNDLQSHRPHDDHRD